MYKTKIPLLFIFIIVAIECIGLRITYPVTASIIAEVGRMGLTDAVLYSGWMMTCYAIMQFIFSPVLGGLSDTYGRRPILLLSLMGLGINYVLLALADSLTHLFAGRIIAGICGASLTTGFAYIADISSPGERTKNFGIVGAAIGFGFIVGPFLGGEISRFGTRAPFFASGLLSLVNLLLGYFILPESLKVEDRRKFSLVRSNPWGALTMFKNNKHIRQLMISLFLLFMAGQVMPSIWPFYTKFLFQWNDLKIGYSLAFIGIMVAVIKGGLISWTQKIIGPIHSVYAGLIFTIIGLTLFSFTNYAWMVYPFALIYCLGGIATPSLQSIICEKFSSREQGEFQGTISSIISLSNIISPVLMTQLFYFFTRKDAFIYFPGAPFAIAAILAMIGFLFSHLELKPRVN